MGVDTWDIAPSAMEGGWKPDEDSGVAIDSWQPDNTGEEDTFTGEFSPENISKHANGDFGAGDNGCRICHEDGHFARDCPNKPAGSNGCFNCGQEGHNKAECPNPRVEREFTGECRSCGEVGHRASDCPTQAPKGCKLCKKTDHELAECPENRVLYNFARLDLKDMPVDEAWSMIVKADAEKDVDDIKEAILTYAKAYPQVKLGEIEEVLRENGMNTYLIAKKQEVSSTHVIVDLQGNMDQKYVLSIQFSPKPRRKKLSEDGQWPETAEENMERLGEAGFALDRMIEKCNNCNELGHSSRKCPEEKIEKEKAVITCAVCSKEGHYPRDCTEPRKIPGQKECKHCGEVGHIGKDCPSKEPEICRNCGEEGHRAKECENERRMKCRNCDEFDHIAKECPKPRNMNRVKCMNCEEMGHFKSKCPNPPKEPENEVGDQAFDAAAGGSAGGDWDNGADGAGGSGGGWEDSSEPAAAVGGW